ncbi:oleandomycin transport system permease protein [Motilibacter rhizosphaerae]|uniref:Transport permease protein n=1 Tax=Motilibacter rhizosphaerae TaxID=598652 RepID=A0A4Q7NUN1_9ACTN|nr:ABC transporter permease [Motilibacter rhizosphaerae]RZS90132.1 oleandomycin transport system permease protein [Motilibacter rhizosphaerae]
MSAATASPASTPRPLLPATVRQSLVLAGRAVRKIVRTPEQLLDVTLQPVIFVLLFVYVFGGAIAGSRHEYLEYVLPALLVQTVLFGSVAIGVNLNTDVEKGVFDRFRSLPISRSAPLVGAVLGDVVRYAVSVVVLAAVGFSIGFDVRTNALEALAGAVLVIGFALCLCWVSVWLGLVARSAGSVQGIAFLVLFPLTFGSNAFVQTSTLPGWLQAWTHLNPVSHVLEAERGLLVGGPVAQPLLVTACWMVGLLAVFVPLATRAYRKRT